MSGGKMRVMPGQTDHGEALRQAARVNDVEKLKELLEKGAEVNASYVSALVLRLVLCYVFHPAALHALFA